MLYGVNNKSQNLDQYLVSTRAAIAKEIDYRMAHYRDQSDAFSDDRNTLFKLMESYALKGKTYRGILAVLGYELFAVATAKSENIAKAHSLAAAMELFQSGLLVHDDIMDRDDLRRGQPTMHRTLEAETKERFERNHGKAPSIEFQRIGESMAICAGDIFYFIAWNIISELNKNIAPLVGSELVNVCLAQIQDVRFGNLPPIPPLEKIQEVYAYKTARYTIYLPLAAGALLAGRAEALPLIEDLGINLGIAFQLRDDWLGLYGDTTQIGKPSGSDIREGKKTPFMVMLHQALPEQEKEKLATIFGNPRIGEVELRYVRDMIASHGIDTRVMAMYEAYAAKARTASERLSIEFPGIDATAYDILLSFIEHTLQRDH